MQNNNLHKFKINSIVFIHENSNVVCILYMRRYNIEKYYLISILSFILFLLVSTLVYRMDLKQEAQVVAVGDNLIHPNVYKDALESDGVTYHFNPMYQHIKKIFKRQILLLSIKNLQLVEIIALIMDLNDLTHLGYFR